MWLGLVLVVCFSDVPSPSYKGKSRSIRDSPTKAHDKPGGDSYWVVEHPKFYMFTTMIATLNNKVGDFLEVFTSVSEVLLMFTSWLRLELSQNS